MIDKNLLKQIQNFNNLNLHFIIDSNVTLIGKG